jgi:hypothetical protein
MAAIERPPVAAGHAARTKGGYRLLVRTGKLSLQLPVKWHGAADADCGGCVPGAEQGGTPLPYPLNQPIDGVGPEWAAALVAKTKPLSGIAGAALQRREIMEISTP